MFIKEYLKLFFDYIVQFIRFIVEECFQKG